MPGPGRKRPVRQSLARQTHAAKSDCLARRRPAGRWNDRNAGLGRFGRGRRRAARPGPGAPGGQRGAGARAASARGAEGSGPGLRLPVAIPRLSQGGNTRGAGLVRGRAGQRRGRVHGRPGRRAASRRLCRRRPAVAARAADAAARLRSKHVYWDMPKDEAARLRDEHRAALPARTRMLAALLATAGAQRCHVPVAPHGAATGAALWLAADRGHAAGGRRRSEPGRRRRTQAAGVPA